MTFGGLVTGTRHTPLSVRAFSERQLLAYFSSREESRPVAAVWCVRWKLILEFLWNRKRSDFFLLLFFSRMLAVSSLFISSFFLALHPKHQFSLKSLQHASYTYQNYELLRQLFLHFSTFVKDVTALRRCVKTKNVASTRTVLGGSLYPLSLFFLSSLLWRLWLYHDVL